MSITMATKEISLIFQELSRLELYCSSCDAAVVIDMTNSKQLFGNADKCCMCKSPLSDKTKAALSAYSRFFDEAKSGDVKIKFRVATDF